MGFWDYLSNAVKVAAGIAVFAFCGAFIGWGVAAAGEWVAASGATAGGAVGGLGGLIGTFIYVASPTEETDRELVSQNSGQRTERQEEHTELPPSYDKAMKERNSGIRKRTKQDIPKKHVIDGNLGNTSENNFRLSFVLRGHKKDHGGLPKVTIGTDINPIEVKIGDKIETKVFTSSAGYEVENGISKFAIDNDFLDVKKKWSSYSIISSPSENKSKRVKLQCEVFKNSERVEYRSFEYKWKPDDCGSRKSSGSIQAVVLNNGTIHNPNISHSHME